MNVATLTTFAASPKFGPAAQPPLARTPLPPVTVDADIQALRMKDVVSITHRESFIDPTSKAEIKATTSTKSYRLRYEPIPLRCNSLADAKAAAALLVKTHPDLDPDHTIAVLQSKSGAFYASALKGGDDGVWIDDTVRYTWLRGREVRTSAIDASAVAPEVKAIIGKWHQFDFTGK